MEGDSLYYGLNAVSNNMIMADRKQLKNPNGLILGTPGSGKSFSAKREITNVFFTTTDDIIVADPEGEYIRKAKTEMNRQLDSLNNLDVEHLPWIEDFKSYQNLTSLNRRVLVELVESITVYDKEHIHIQYRFDQEIRNVLEYCNSIPTTETEGSTV